MDGRKESDDMEMPNDVEMSGTAADFSDTDDSSDTCCESSGENELGGLNVEDMELSSEDEYSSDDDDFGEDGDNLVAGPSTGLVWGLVKAATAVGKDKGKAKAKAKAYDEGKDSDGDGDGDGGKGGDNKPTELPIKRWKHHCPVCKSSRSDTCFDKGHLDLCINERHPKVAAEYAVRYGCMMCKRKDIAQDHKKKKAERQAKAQAAGNGAACKPNGKPPGKDGKRDGDGDGDGDGGKRGGGTRGVKA
ncbi:hypothetical protein B0T24DRAFT_668458 [Lasiosphaeria ovina]|uniref:Uncharacterized protein n=1 Tax=Lasiosphaeria ovina TaxID=92902 RepID=A0AAE0MXT6_9PEZI|nr:hypothetical protein B0T24DRAFT_725573 [Lasiosphaeria ovina]KAK3368863.1 hypothetical protein B0T24DRAFT_668458 [Lasiosphaeria ovina]